MTNITALTRCTAKNLIPGPIPPDGAAPVDMISVLLAVQTPSQTTGLTGSVSLTYSLADDQLQLGNYYDMQIKEGTAPLNTKKT